MDEKINNRLKDGHIKIRDNYIDKLEKENRALLIMLTLVSIALSIIWFSNLEFLK